MSEGAQLNGPASQTGRFIDTVDPDDPEYIRNLQRPAEVKEDMKQMEGRSRVSVVLNSQAFKDELEAVIHEQMRQGGPASIFALQQISDLLLPPSRGGQSSFSRSSPVIPINDIRGVETFGYSKQEKVLRCKLAACYRAVDLFGWTHGIYNHISVRLSQEQEQFLLNPFGMLYSEITASTLAKVDVRGEVVDTGSTGLGISKAGFTLHSAIHQARPDIRCIIHLHTPAAVAVSASKCGLLPMSQEALICGKISYHDYRGILVDQEERDQLARNLGPMNKVMFLRNHGVVACGETIEEAFHYSFNVMAAVETQMKAMPVGLDNLILVDEETQEKTFKVGSQGGGGTDTSGRKYKCGELEWEALMRTLDNSGYRTGHIYKQPLMKQEKKEKTNSDVEVPPASSSFTYIFDGDYEHSKYVSPIKTALERQKQAYKAGWLTSPNTYKKQEIEEIGTTTPKKITKWVQDGDSSMTKSTAIKVENPNQFAPQGINPKEFKEKQKSIRKDYYEEKVTAGPTSKILEGISWDEAAKKKEAGDQTIVVGAASKGIIQRDHQHNAVVYRSYYSANPFDNMSEDEVKAYKQEVEQREKGEEEAEDVPGPEGRLISTEERMQNIQLSREDVQEDTEEPAPSAPVRRSESERYPQKNRELIREMERKGVVRSQSDRRSRGEGDGDKPGSPTKSDPMDSASGGETLEEHSSKEGSPTKEAPSPVKEKKKKKKFRMPSFSKKKKDSKDSTI
ncbi:protein hu-li tai shao-like isoform X3 [Babylonia areolata]|uniref:protein hu-li tai shao-like isoform X3 n=1 Tax=Babylonia areolata TaxID=304850 RepID=UPI003FD42C72